MKFLTTWMRFSLLLLAVATAASAAEPKDLARLLPADTLLAVQIHNVPRLLQQWDASPFYHFYGDPRAGSFFSPLKKKIEGFRQTMNASQGMDPDRFWQFFNGELILAGVATPPGSPVPMEWVLIFEHSGDPQILQRLKQPHQPATAQIRQSSAQFAGLKYRRVELIREVPADAPTVKSSKKKSHHKKSGPKLPSLAGDEGEKGPDLSLNRLTGVGGAPAVVALKKQVSEEYDDYFGSGLIIHAGSRGMPIKKVLSLLAQPGSSLLGRPDLAELKRTAGRQGDITAYANVAALARWYEHQSSKEGKREFFDLAQLHLDEVKAAILNLDLLQDRAAMDLAVLAPQPRQGISRLLFLGDGKPADVTRLVPNTAVAYSSANLSPASLWMLSLDTLAATAPAISLALDTQLEAFEQNAGLKIKSDLLGQLGTHVARFLLPSGEAKNPRELATYMVDVRNAPALRINLLNLLNYGAQVYGAYHIETSTLGKWPLWTILGGRAGAGAGADGQPLLNFCVTDNWLLCGARRDGMEAVAQRLQKPSLRSLAGQQSFAKVMGPLPPDRFCEVYLDTGGIRKLLDSGILAMASPGKGSKSRKKGEWSPLNLAAMPAQPVWSEYFGPFVSAASHAGDQVRIRSFILYP